MLRELCPPVLIPHRTVSESNVCADRSSVICSMLQQMGDTDSTIPCLQKLLCAALLSPEVSVSPIELLRHCGIDPEKEDNAFRFFTAFYQQLNSCFESSISQKGFLDSLFGGLRRQSQCCLNCHRVFYRPDRFFFLNCPVTSDTRLEEALQLLFSKTALSDSAFLCPSFFFLLSLTLSCRIHCSAEALTTLSEIPPILVIRLERATPGSVVRLPSSLNLLSLCRLVRLLARSDS